MCVRDAQSRKLSGACLYNNSILSLSAIIESVSQNLFIGELLVCNGFYFFSLSLPNLSPSNLSPQLRIRISVLYVYSSANVKNMMNGLGQSIVIQEIRISKIELSVCR